MWEPVSGQRHARNQTLEACRTRIGHSRLKRLCNVRKSLLVALDQNILRQRDCRAAVGFGGKREGLFLHAAYPRLVGGGSALERSCHHGKPTHHFAALEEQIAKS